jgi:NAD-dependent DNA ligase
MNMKQAHYWQMQEDRWHQQYLAAEKLLDQLEVKIWEQSSEVENLKGALRKICEINNKRDRFSSEIDDIVVEALKDRDV